MSEPVSPEREAAELRKLEIEIRKLAAEAEIAELDRNRRTRKEADEFHAADNQRLIDVGTMSDAYNHHVSATLDLLHRQAPGEAITLVINSPGGSVFSGLALCDKVLELRAAGTPVHTEVRGMAASMAGVLAQVGERRTMSKNSYLMIHEAASGAFGKASDLEDTVDLIKRLQEKLLAILSSRSNLTPAQIKRRWLRKDWWLDADESLKLGLVDEVL